MTYKAYKHCTKTKPLFLTCVDTPEYAKAVKISDILEITYRCEANSGEITILFPSQYLQIEGHNLQELFDNLLQGEVSHLYTYSRCKDLPNLNNIKEPIILDCFFAPRELSKEEKEIVESLEESRDILNIA